MRAVHVGADSVRIPFAAEIDVNASPALFHPSPPKVFKNTQKRNRVCIPQTLMQSRKERKSFICFLASTEIEFWEREEEKRVKVSANKF